MRYCSLTYSCDHFRECKPFAQPTCECGFCESATTGPTRPLDGNGIEQILQAALPSRFARHAQSSATEMLRRPRALSSFVWRAQRSHPRHIDGAPRAASARRLYLLCDAPSTSGKISFFKAVTFHNKQFRAVSAVEPCHIQKQALHLRDQAPLRFYGE